MVVVRVPARLNDIKLSNPFIQFQSFGQELITDKSKLNIKLFCFLVQCSTFNVQCVHDRGSPSTGWGKGLGDRG